MFLPSSIAACLPPEKMKPGDWPFLAYSRLAPVGQAILPAAAFQAALGSEYGIDSIGCYWFYCNASNGFGQTCLPWTTVLSHVTVFLQGVTATLGFLERRREPNPRRPAWKRDKHADSRCRPYRASIRAARRGNLPRRESTVL